MCVLVVEGGSPPSSLFSFFLSHFWPLFFYPSLMPTQHAHTQGCHKQVRGLMQKEAAEAGELTHPCPCPWTQKRSTRPGTALSPTSNSSPGVVRRSVPQHLKHYLPMPTYITSRGTDLLLLPAHKTPCDICVSRDFRAYPTVRPRYGCGAVRYGTVRHESSPAQCRLGQHFNIPSIGIDPVPHAVS